MTSWKTPTPEQVANASVALNRPEAAAYFFGQLNNPLWILPLRDLGHFRTPPPALKDNDAVSFPVWPAARYLVRMAALGPDEGRAAAETVLLAHPTNNHIVHLAYAEVALAAPADIATKIASAERTWIREQRWLFAVLPEKYGELAAHLAKLGRFGDAMRLARTLLSFLSEPDDTESHKDPRARFEQWEYGEVMKRVVPAFSEVDPVGGIEFVANLLLDYARRLGHGHSIGWRPAIEDSDQNGSDLSDVLVDATRDACETVVRSGGVPLSTVLEVLARKRHFPMFERLRVHLVRIFRERDTALVCQELLDTSRLHSIELRHEYSLLMRDGFGLLNAPQRDTLLEAVASGPVATHWDLSKAEERAGFERYAREWKRDRLAVIRDSLPADWKAVYDGLVEELGAPSHPEFGVHHTMWHGPQSPKSTEALQAMSLTALVEYLVVWRPTRDFMAPDPEGLGRALELVAAHSPERFVSEEAKLHRLHPVYVRSILSGIAAAIKTGKQLDLVSLLRLLGWAAAQTELPYALPGRFTDSGWGWTRKAILDVLVAGFQSKSELPFTLRESAWSALSPALEDPNPTPDDEHPEKEEFEPGDVALNTVRGYAMHALIQYALWVHRALEKQADGEARLRVGFNEMPEVRQALEAHLDPARDPSLGVRSVYGQWFPWLVLLDPEWARGASARIFPASEQETERRDAAWLTYLSHNRPYRNVVEHILDQYNAAVDRIATTSRIRVRSLRPANEILGDHLVAMYAQGWIELDGGALVRFFERADLDTRTHVLAGVGRGLSPRAEEPAGNEQPSSSSISTEVVARLRRLWEWRISAETRDRRESAAFGWWFACGAFDDRWSWDHLVSAVEEAGRLDGLTFAARRLAIVGPRAPREATRVLMALITDPAQPWTTFELKPAIRPVIAAAIRSDEDTRRMAVYILNRLGERGFNEYADLLPT